nr:hypothetical protein [uncultured Cohaesibacter sp.]
MSASHNKFLPFTALFLMVAAPAYALECPQLSNVDSTVGISLTQQKVESYRSLLGDGSEGNGLDEVIHDIRENNPDATKTDIVNALMATYCPVIANADYPDDIARQKLRAFATQAEDTLYSAR